MIKTIASATIGIIMSVFTYQVANSCNVDTLDGVIISALVGFLIATISMALVSLATDKPLESVPMNPATIHPSRLAMYKENEIIEMQRKYNDYFRKNRR